MDALDSAMDVSSYSDLSYDDAHHHLAKRYLYPGRPVTEMFNQLLAPENFPVFAVVSFTIMAFRTIGVVLASERNSIYCVQYEA